MSGKDRYCCNPLELPHTKRISSSCRPVTMTQAEQLKKLTGRDYYVDKNILCPTCRKEINRKHTLPQIDSTVDTDMDVSKIEATDLVNTSATTFSLSPLKFMKVSERDSRSYAKRKVRELQTSIVKEIATAGGLQPKDISQAGPSSEGSKCKNCNDYDILLEEMKTKMEKCSTKAEKIQILTLHPKSWSIQQIMSEFKVPERMVRTANKLIEKEGILAMPEKKRGRPLCSEIKDLVHNFYMDEEYSRVCPGMKDKISVRIDGVKQEKQKYLLLCNIKELYVEFQKAYPTVKIGISKFFQLRPKWCITVGTAGTHSVCVCMIHQNVKLMLAGISVKKEEYKTLISKTVCNMEEKECMLHSCDACPGQAGATEYLWQILTEKDTHPDDEVEFQQWVHIDRDTLITITKTVEEFIVDLGEKISKLSTHHYIAKHQTQHLKKLNENLQPQELIIIMDFAENYSFVVQDSVQGFHWENSQATIHPFAVYIKENDKVVCKSMCIISDYLSHNAIAVYIFIRTVIQFLKSTVQGIEHIHYFSDGSVAQYKNYKNFANLCCHLDDYGITADWNFFATSHGKSACDGIGGTIKRLAQRESLQHPVDGHILTVHDLFKFSKKIKGIKTFLVESNEIEAIFPQQNKRFANSHTVSGTRDNHFFSPIDGTKLRVSRVSSDTVSFISNVFTKEHVKVSCTQLQPGQYVACIYETKWWIGNVCKVSIEEQDAQISFMHPNGPCTTFYWPKQRDVCWVPEKHIISITAPPIASSLGRNYSIDKLTSIQINNKYLQMQN